jgi:L,D-transpeptidase YcbB
MRLILSAAAVYVLALTVPQPAAAVETGSLDTTSRPPAVAATPAPTPSPMAQAIRQRLTDRRLQLTAEERLALATFYDRAGASLFAGPSGLTPRGIAVVRELTRADDYGLPATELVPLNLPQEGASLSEPDIAGVEVRLVAAILKYARSARGGRITDPAQQLTTYIDRKPQLLPAKTVLDTIAAAPQADVALRGFNPQHPQFEALRKAYVAARKAKTEGLESDAIPDGPSLRAGMRHPRVALLRLALKSEGHSVPAEPADPEVFDDELVQAVVAYQEANGLDPADGIVGPKTRAALNSLKPPTARRLLANMEQWRWMPADLGLTHIHVNIPEFTVRMINNNGIIHRERVVTGLVTNQTPIFSEDMRTVVLQPDWVLPESIKINEALPSLTGGDGIFWKNGLKIKRGTTEIDPGSVNWVSADPRAYTFYQPPGEANVLGKVKFLFPNKHAVYMHDTPAKHLFDRAERAFSHGCMRVRDPVKLAELILMQDKGWTAGKVQELLEDGPEDNKISLDRKIPVHVTYFTAVPDDAGRIRTYRDLYGHEERIALALEGRWSEIEVLPDHLAPLDDREFDVRAASYERRRPAGGERRPSGNGSVENALENLFGGF